MEDGHAPLTQVYPGLTAVNASDMTKLAPLHDDYEVSSSCRKLDDGWDEVDLRITRKDKPGADTEQSTCKRCRVLYKPRIASWYGRSMMEKRFGVVFDEEVPESVTKLSVYPPDAQLLVNGVSGDDYCPRCEEHLRVVREKLIKCLDTPRKEGECGQDKPRSLV